MAIFSRKAGGLSCGPSPLRAVNYRPQADGGWNEYQQADATNLYIHVDDGGPASFLIDAEFGN